MPTTHKSSYIFFNKHIKHRQLLNASFHPTNSTNMAQYKVAILLCLCGVVALSSAGQLGLSNGLGTSYGGLSNGYGLGGGQDYFAHPKYSYQYGVTDGHTGDIKDAYEQRDGGLTIGGYSLLQPDGQKRTVEYTATSQGGFNAHVSYNGLAEHSQGYQQSYLQ